MKSAVELDIVAGDVEDELKKTTDSSCDSERSVLEMSKPRKPQNGTLLASLTSMIITMVGLGIFGLPLAFAETGIIGGSVLVIVCGIATDVGLVALVRVQKVSGGECYEEVSQFYFGTAGLAIVYFLLNLDLTMASAQMLTPFAQYSGESILRWSNCWDATLKVEGNDALGGSICTGWNEATITILPIVLVFPFTLKKTVNALKWASFGSFICLVVSIVIFFHYYLSWEHLAGTDSKEQYRDFFLPIHKTVSLWAPFDMLSFIDAIGIVFYAYVCFFQVLLLYSELETKKNIYPVIHGATLGFAVPLYLLIGISGYCLFGEKLAVDGEAFMFKLMHEDYAPKHFLIFAIGVTSALKIPFCMNPIRDATYSLINTGARRYYSISRNVIPDTVLYRIPMALFLSILAYVMALTVPLDVMFVYAGSLTGASLSGYVVGFLLLAYVFNYGVVELPPSPSTSSRLRKCGIMYPKVYRALSRKMKMSYIVAWVLILYGILGTVLGLTTPIAKNFFGYSYKFPCRENGLC